MKKKLMLAIAAILIIVSCTTIAFADTTSGGKCGDNITWTLSGDGTLTLTGTGAMYNYSVDGTENTPPWYRNAYDIKKCIISNGITTIGNCAFYDCKNMSEIAIPDGLESFGNDCLYETGITSIYIPKSIKSLGDYYSSTFQGCNSLKKVILADIASYLNIEETYFLAAKPFSKGADLYLNGEKVTELIIPTGITEIPSGAFNGCSSITKISIPSTVKKIGRSAFAKCMNLQEIDAPHLSTNFDFSYLYSEDVGFFSIGQSKCTTASATIWWTKVPNAVKYEITCNINGKEKIIKSIDDASVNSITLTKKQLKNTRDVSVRIYYDDGVSPEMKYTDNFTNIAFAPKKATLKSLASSAKAVTAKWNVIEDTTGYQVMISSTSSFKKGTTYTYTIKNGSAVSKKLKKCTSTLKAGKKYYIKVRAFNERYCGNLVPNQTIYGAWSNTKSIICK